MGELTSRLSLYAAVDEAVLERAGDVEFLGRVSRFIPAYDADLPPDKNSVEVVDGVETSMEQGADPADQTEGRRTTVAGWSIDAARLIPSLRFNSLTGALDEMAGNTELSRFDAAKRLTSVWMIANLLVDEGSDLDATLVQALRPITSIMPRGQAERDSVATTPITDNDRELAVLSVLRDLPDAEAFERQVVTRTHKLIAADIAQAAAMTCSDSNVYATVGDEREVAAQMTTTATWSAGGRNIDQIRELVKPERWPDCLGSFWCAMNKCPPLDSADTDPVFYRQEVVGDFDPPGPPCDPAEVWFDPVLRFAYRNVSGGFELQYDLASATQLATTSKSQTTEILVDTGVMHMRLANDELTVDTIKVIRLPEPISGAGMSILACAAGWADHSRAMFLGCLSPTP